MTTKKFLVAALAVLITAAGALVGKPAAAAPAPVAGTLRVFGDSYSDPSREAFDDWVEQLVAKGKVTAAKSYAKSGAFASSTESNSFARQIGLFKKDNVKFGPTDVTVVFFGLNDILKYDDTFTQSRTGYRDGLKALLAAGATKNGARMWFVQVPDLGDSPAFNSDPAKKATYHQKTVLFNKFITKVAKELGVTNTIGLYTLFTDVVANPSEYGLNNVKTVDKPRSAKTALYADIYHYGRAGHAIIAESMFQHFRNQKRAAASEAALATP